MERAGEPPFAAPTEPVAKVTTLPAAAAADEGVGTGSAVAGVAGPVVAAVAGVVAGVVAVAVVVVVEEVEGADLFPLETCLSLSNFISFCSRKLESNS